MKEQKIQVHYFFGDIMNRNNFNEYLGLENVKINDEFWNKIISLVDDEVIPYQYLALQDKIDGAEKSYCISNFIKAKKVKDKIENNEEYQVFPTDKWCYDENNSDENAFHGWVFQDSDVYKWIEAVGYSLQNNPNKDLEQKADEYIDIICDAQLNNGYLNTHYIINNINNAFTNLRDHHELYCFGHLVEGAISYYNATKKDKLLNTACRFADLICDTFGEDKTKGYGGHEIAEMALFKLYKLTGKKEYLDTARFFINERGKKPYYFDIEQKKITVEDNYHYNQAHTQPKNQHEAVGHAVRGVYLYSAMADIAKECNDTELLNACNDIWDNIVNKKMYITGGIGSTVDGEAFSFNYDLPNDLAYAETCASIGLVFFAKRMSEIDNKAEYSNVIERALYNTILSSMSEDGKSFYYVNPLEVLPEASHKDSRKRHVKPVRQKWFSCACCPPNLARLLSSLGSYIFSENENTIYINQFISSTAKASKATIELTENKIKITDIKKAFLLGIRIPYWCDSFEVSMDYKAVNGYAIISINDNCEIDYNIKKSPRLIKCSNKVRANVGKVSLMYGPMVYCLEEADNGNNLQMLLINPDEPLILNDDCITASGFREKEDERLYSTFSKYELEDCRLKFIPYYRWGNRGENEMSVYVRVK